MVIIQIVYYLKKTKKGYGKYMNKADRIYLGKVFVDYTDAIEATQKEIGQTTDMMKAIIEGLGINDKRPDEVSMYQQQLKQLLLYAESKGISLNELIQLGEEYKTVSFANFLTLKSQITIKEELDKVLNQ
ncbi:hypothetical protein CVD28_03585 [Bacillus sp. M6-12]|uniref:hypothetical protein n=1 Tax=Bacillus sp. M6-12 TaxID=2054166 RepID=UPI000C77B32C|nr:hypothetical protein [Bacillus sp. M6-12]PLS19510.1 hypothetical protein CVD28_03585 [Bacillus sp. M6-12]